MFPLPSPKSALQAAHLRRKRCLLLELLRMEMGRWEFEAQMDLYAHMLSLGCWVTFKSFGVNVAANNNV